MPVSFTLGVTAPPNTQVGAYTYPLRPGTGVSPTDPPPRPPVTVTTTDGSGTITFTDLAYETAYVAGWVDVDGVTWRYYSFRTADEPGTGGSASVSPGTPSVAGVVRLGAPGGAATYEAAATAQAAADGAAQFSDLSIVTGRVQTLEKQGVGSVQVVPPIGGAAFGPVTYATAISLLLIQDATQARPAVPAGGVLWFTTATPTNAIDGDLWFNNGATPPTFNVRRSGSFVAA